MLVVFPALFLELGDEVTILLFYRLLLRYSKLVRISANCPLVGTDCCICIFTLGCAVVE